MRRDTATEPAEAMHETVYRTLRDGLISGRFPPGQDVSLRGLAATLGAGVMPVREAVRRLVAEHALELTGTRRARVPTMDAARFDELMRARLLLEPECAARALPAIDAPRIRRARGHDAALEASLAGGRPDQYLAGNYAFHFEIYRAARSDVLVPLLESVWMRFGPFMRTVYGLVGTAALIDKHALALDALERRDEAALRAAVTADILDGMHLLGRSRFPPREPCVGAGHGRGQP